MCIDARVWVCVHACAHVCCPLSRFAPHGWKTEAGPQPELEAMFGLRQLESADAGYGTADRANVGLCDALVGFRYRVPQTGRGCEKTINFARRNEYAHVALEWPPQGVDTQLLEGGKPVFVVWDLSDQNYAAVCSALVSFVRSRSVRCLMVSGPCASTNPEGVKHIEGILTAAFRQLATKMAALYIQH